MVAGRVQRKLDLGLNLENRYIILITISCNVASSSSLLLLSNLVNEEFRLTKLFDFRVILDNKLSIGISEKLSLS